MDDELELTLTVNVRLANWMDDQSPEHVAWLINDAVDNNGSGILILDIDWGGRKVYGRD